MVTSSYQLDIITHLQMSHVAGWQTVPVYNTASLYRCKRVYICVYKASS